MKNNHLKPHELALLFPPLEKEAAAELSTDIKINGQRDPIILFENKILDGVQRYGACLDARVEPETTKFEFTDAFHKGIHPVDFVMSKNLHRRHLSKGQRAVVYVSAENLRKKKFSTFEENVERGNKTWQEQNIAEGKKAVSAIRKIRKTDVGMSQRRSELAAEAQVSPRLIEMAERVQKEAPRKLQAIKDGKVALHDVFHKLPPTDRQRKNAEERAEKLRAGLTLEDTIRKLREKARRNGGQIYVELGGYAFRCFQLCRGK